eukprot:365072-Chlamydomonas_euryale.AAC.1
MGRGDSLKMLSLRCGGGGEACAPGCAEVLNCGCGMSGASEMAGAGGDWEEGTSRAGNQLQGISPGPGLVSWGRVHTPHTSVHMPHTSVLTPHTSVHMPRTCVRAPHTSVHMPRTSVHTPHTSVCQLLERDAGVSARRCLDVQLAHTVVAAADAAAALAAGCGGQARDSLAPDALRPLQPVDFFGSVGPPGGSIGGGRGVKDRGGGGGGRDPFSAMLAAHGLAPLHGGGAARAEVWRNRTAWLARPLPGALLRAAASEAEALMALGERLLEQLRAGAAAGSLVAAQAKLRAWV